MYPSVSIIVLNYNGRQHLEYCLPSILATDYPNFSVIVVDNHSTDDSVAYMLEHHADIQLLSTDANLGWAGGNNLGIECALTQGAEYVLLANNDIRVHPQWVRSAVQASASDPHIGLVGFHVIGAMHPGCLEAFRLACEQWDGNAWSSTEFVHGMALFTKAEVLTEIGLFDPDFFFYGEENDFELRAQTAGYCMVETNVPVWHHSQGTSARTPIRSSYFAMRNTLRYTIKNQSFFQVLRILCILLHTSCNPFFVGDRDNVCIRRLRPRNPAFNALLLCAALIWNVLFLPVTLRARCHDRGRALEARRRRRNPCAE